MGQRANGILYGCEAPEALAATEENEEPIYEPIYDLISEWCKANKIPFFGPGLHIRHENAGGKDLLGVWVAVGGSGEDGPAYFIEEAMLLSQVERVYAKNIAAATKLWKRFAAWVKKAKKIVLTEPALWLTPCEVA
jgi:hypothetical protein